MLNLFDNASNAGVAGLARSLVNEDRILFSDKSPKMRRAKAWFDAQVRRAAKEGSFCIDAKLYPELASYILKHNPANRSVSRTGTERLKRDMVEGRWVRNGETIIVSEEGQLNDGQHRCVACIEAGVEIDVTFYFGATRKSRITVDQGLVKQPGHYLDMEQVKNSTAVAHAARVVYLYDKFGKITKNADIQPTKGQILVVVAEHPELLKSIDRFGKKRVGAATNSLIGAMHYLFARIDRAKADIFITDVLKGADLKLTDPAFVLRDRLISDKLKGKVVEAVTAELFIRAWNMRRANRKATKLQVGESFPKAV